MYEYFFRYGGFLNQGNSMDPWNGDIDVKMFDVGGYSVLSLIVSDLIDRLRVI